MNNNLQQVVTESTIANERNTSTVLSESAWSSLKRAGIGGLIGLSLTTLAYFSFVLEANSIENQDLNPDSIWKKGFLFAGTGFGIGAFVAASVQKKIIRLSENKSLNQLELNVLKRVSMSSPSQAGILDGEISEQHLDLESNQARIDLEAGLGSDKEFDVVDACSDPKSSQLSQSEVLNDETVLSHDNILEQEPKFIKASDIFGSSTSLESVELEFNGELKIWGDKELSEEDWTFEIPEPPKEDFAPVF